MLIRLRTAFVATFAVLVAACATGPTYTYYTYDVAAKWITQNAGTQVPRGVVIHSSYNETFNRELDSFGNPRWTCTGSSSKRGQVNVTITHREGNLVRGSMLTTDECGFVERNGFEGRFNDKYLYAHFAANRTETTALRRYRIVNGGQSLVPEVNYLIKDGQQDAYIYPPSGTLNNGVRYYTSYLTASAANTARQAEMLNEAQAAGRATQQRADQRKRQEAAEFRAGLQTVLTDINTDLERQNREAQARREAAAQARAAAEAKERQRQAESAAAATAQREKRAKEQAAIAQANAQALSRAGNRQAAAQADATRKKAEADAQAARQAQARQQRIAEQERVAQLNAQQQMRQFTASTRNATPTQAMTVASSNTHSSGTTSNGTPKTEVALATPPSGTMSTVGLGPRPKKMGEPGKGRLSGGPQTIGRCKATGVTVAYDLYHMVGEPMVIAQLDWTGEPNCKYPLGTKVWLKLQKGTAYGWIEGYSLNGAAANAGLKGSLVSSSWSRLVCAHANNVTTECMTEADARTLWGTGQITGFAISWPMQ